MFSPMSGGGSPFSKSPCFLQMPVKGMSKKAYVSSSKPDETNCVRHPPGQKRRVTPFIFGVTGSKKYRLNSWKSVNWYRRNRKRDGTLFVWKPQEEPSTGMHQSNTDFLSISIDIRTVQSTLESNNTSNFVAN